MSSIVYCIMDNYVCDDYLCFLKTRLRVTITGQGFENRTYNDVSVISITELLINIISFHGFLNNMNSAVIFSCYRKIG